MCSSYSEICSEKIKIIYTMTKGNPFIIISHDVMSAAFTVGDIKV